MCSCGEFQLRQGQWKLLDYRGAGGNDYDHGDLAKVALPERDPDAPGQPYDLDADSGETTNLWSQQAARREAMLQLLEQLQASGRSAPSGRQPLGIERIPVRR